MAEVDGATLVARNLKRQGVKFMFGIVGFPVQPIAAAAQKEGITYVGMRNEQSASYAAQAVGYLTGRPGACLVVSGPGVVHALAGLANAQQNGWPMILIGGASESWRNGMGAFQEERQVLIATPFCKFAHAVEHVHRIPFYIEMAVRNSIYGRPGASYLDLPDDIITGKVDESRVDEPARCPDPPRTQAMPADVERALNTLRSAERPLVIIGKGMAYSRAEDEVRAFIERTKVPFLASPMGKGVMPDTHPLSVGAARSHALQNADVVFLMGARLNWIMHFGLPPRFNKNVRIIQLDIAPESIGQNAPTEVALVGDGKAIVAQINEALGKREWVFPKDSPWHAAIAEKAAANAAQIAPQLADDQAPANYYRALKDVAAATPARCRQLRHDGYRHGLRHRRRGRASGQADHLGFGRLRDRLLRHGDGDGLPLSAAGQDRRLQQRRHGSGTREASGQPAPEPEAQRADLRRALRQDDGGVRRQGLVRREPERSEERAGSGDGVPRPGAGQRHDLSGVGPQAAAVPLAQLIRCDVTARGRSARTAPCRRAAFMGRPFEPYSPR